MKSDTSSEGLTIPPALLGEIQAEAEKEHRPALDLLQDAVKRYIRDKRWQKIYEYGEERAKALGLVEKDVPRLIAEYREEQRQGRE